MGHQNPPPPRPHRNNRGGYGASKKVGQSKSSSSAVAPVVGIAWALVLVPLLAIGLSLGYVAFA